ncbi:hypothetical protein CARUB_v10024875mg [Capsella rubella]|uniref:Uncharacterized protein n=1 Tax=Capsella rubella TaxID=81985 RepID=R0HX41_9BRAS|nr:putative defensin-like protein 303 [Capsella rubella]EOA28653.1 hypothetical protein CARUB_v10024875mg [Capsella rubella]
MKASAFFIALLVIVYGVETIESRNCEINDDCKDRQPCSVPLACVFGNCICPSKNQSKIFIPPCPIVCARIGEKTLNQWPPCVCIKK